MNILKIGKNHIETGMNCQDAIGRYGEELKIVCDGCSELFERRADAHYSWENPGRIDDSHG